MMSLTMTYGGKGGPRSGHIREARRGVAHPSFTVRANETLPIRLNSDLGLRFPPDLLSTIPTNEEKLAYLRHEIAGALDLFANYQRKFLNRYFDFIVDRCAGAAERLEAGLAWSGGLFHAEDFVFSALWPLPDCTLTLLTDTGFQPAGTCDFAFWTGRHVIAVTLTGSPDRRDTENMEESSPIFGIVKPVAISATDLNTDPVLFLEPRFPPEFGSFWQSDHVPSSPFRPDGLTFPAHGAL